MDASGRYRLLLVEDDASQRTALAGFLRKRGYDVVEAGSAGDAGFRAGDGAVDLLITDLRLGGPDGIALLADLRRLHPDLQAIVVTAYGTLEDAVRAMRAGAYDFVAKPIDLGRLDALVEKALEKVSLTRENRSLRRAADEAGAFADLVGEGRALRSVKDIAAKVAPTRAPILVLGETGTGKEVLARAIHRLSGRSSGPFVTLNCAVLSETLVESELFGHEKGAFTGATSLRKGRFELARGGTLFLDEVGDIPPTVQVKLLNVLQTGRFERVGGTQSIATDARLIAATHKDLERCIAAGTFRADLYYRINVVTLRMPALRERTDDIGRLVEHFVHKHADLSPTGIAGASPEALEALAQRAFPGNVRELENLVERALVLAEGPILGPEDFAAVDTIRTIIPEDTARAPDDLSLPCDLEAQVARLERDLVRRALALHDGNRSAAARDLGLSERVIRYKLRRLGL